MRVDGHYIKTYGMLEQNAVHIGSEADVAAHVLDVQGRQLSVEGLLDTGAVVSVLPISTRTDMGFNRSYLLPTSIRLAAANQREIYVAGRTPIILLQLGGRHLWMSFWLSKTWTNPTIHLRKRLLAKL